MKNWGLYLEMEGRVTVRILFPVSLSKQESCFLYQPHFSMQIKGGDWLEITPSDVKLQTKLGEGAFGEAYKGLVRVDKQWRECAVKKLKGKEVKFVLINKAQEPANILSMSIARST